MSGGKMSAGARNRCKRLVCVTSAAVAASLAFAVPAASAVSAVSAATGPAASTARAHSSNPSCSQILPAASMNAALSAAGPGAGGFSSVETRKSFEWYYPYNQKQSQPGSQCAYLWQASQVPADY